MGLLTSDAEIGKRLIDISYDVRILSIDMKYLFANQQHLLEYLVRTHKSEIERYGKEILDRLEYSRRLEK